MAAFSSKKGETQVSKGTKKYFKKKIIWFLITLVVAVLLNFFLPRLMRGAGTPTRYDPEIINAVSEKYGYEKGKLYSDDAEWAARYDEVGKELGVLK